MATPPDFSVGQVLTAAQMNAVGLWLVKTQTIGSAVSSVTVSNAFSADFDNYLIQVSGGSASTGTYVRMQLGSKTTGYNFGIFIGAGFGTASGNATFAATVTGTGINYLGYGSSNGITASITVLSPNLAKNTVVQAQVTPHATNSGFGATSAWINDTTQYTAFNLLTESGTFTGGTIRVFGYRN